MDGKDFSHSKKIPMEQIQKFQEKPLIKNLQVAITPTGNIDTKRVDRMGVNLELKKFKTQTGSINFPELFSIPSDQRLAKMAEADLGATIKMVTVALTLAFETMNLSRPMQPFQILDLAEAIVDSAAEEDKPAMEDLMLFLQKLTRGEYGPLYESLDIPKFMTFYNKYRDERWSEAWKLRQQKDDYFKKLGGDDLFDRMHRKPETPFEEYLQSYNTRIQAKNDEIKALREENRRKR